MEKRELNTIIALALVIGFFAGALGGAIASLVLYRAFRFQSAGWPGQTLLGRYVPALPPQVPAGWSPAEAAAPKSVEWQLHSQGKHWARTTGDFTVGAYVEDNLTGRMGQPHGRGAIGKVVALGTDPNGPPGVMVDFGRGFVVGINESELSLVQVKP